MCYLNSLRLIIFLSVLDWTRIQADSSEFSSSPQIEVRGDVSFLEPHRLEKLDLYLPKQRKAGEKSPAVLLIHGGGWKEGDKRQPREIEFGATLAENGYVAASINYALRSAGKFPLNLQDCKNGIRYLRAHADALGIDSDRISVMGSSAGGHLALMVAYTGDDRTFAPTEPYPGVSDKVSCVVDFYGITDIGTRKKTDPNGNPTELRGVESEVQAIFGSKAEDWKKASPVTYVKQHIPPTLILHGKKDTTVDFDQSQELADALKKAGATYDIIWLPNAPHSFSFQYAVPKSKQLLERDVGPAVLSFLKNSQNK
jgi:acetyl esterase/lipase